MNADKILLLDFSPVSQLSADLLGVLASGPKHSCEVHRPCPNDVGEIENVRTVQAAISRAQPALLVLVATLNVLRPAARALAKMFVPHTPPFIVVSDTNEPDDVVDAYKLGAIDYITPPLRRIDILPRVWRAIGQALSFSWPQDQIQEMLSSCNVFGQSPHFLQEVGKIPRIAKSDVSVLISGETGTGKEVCARAIHRLSARAGKPFVPVNCGAIPIELAENELFGHERGAFTGAASAAAGLVQQADGGTLFLDEIDSLPLLAQVKLLRFLQDGEYRPLGSSVSRRADVRVVTATNIDVVKALTDGRLRQDLYYRLDIIPIALPPLRDRRDDIPLLANWFLRRHSAGPAGGSQGFSSDAMRLLLLHNWPGNVRELENVVRRAAAMSVDPLIQPEDVAINRRTASAAEESFRDAKARFVAEFERTYLQSLLLAYEGNVTRAAKAARKHRRAFWELLRKHHINARRSAASTVGTHENHLPDHAPSLSIPVEQ